MKKNRLFLFTAIFSILLASCNTGLGDALDLTGPDVTITSPTMNESVSENFTVSGTAYDNVDVKKLTVSIDDGNEWKNEDGVWTFKAKDTEEYVPYDDAEWEKDEAKKIKWQVKNVNISSGKHIITVTAMDAEKNTTSNSRKMVAVIFDNVPPTVTITSPNIKYKKFGDLESYFSSKTDYRQIQIVNSVVTGGFTVSGITADDNPVSYVRLFVKKVDESTGEAVKTIEKNLVLADSDVTFNNAIQKDTLRSWTVDITDADLAELDLGNGKNYLQISTEASDNAGNKDAGTDIDGHGYIVLWKAANNPWVEINLGSAEAEETKVYSGASVQGTAFDNKQVAKVTLSINKKNGSTWEPISDDYNKKEIAIKYDAEDLSQTSTFKFNYPSDVGHYQIVLSATDTEGNESEQVTTGYIEVQDMSFPSVRVDPITNPFGDQDGNFTLNVTALDDTKVEKVKYKLCIGDSADADKANYSDKAHTGWSSATEITVAQDSQDSTETDEGGYVRKKYKGNIKLNLFDDLNIAMSGSGKRKLEQTTFIFYVEDGHTNKSVTKFVLPADITPPTVTLTKVDNTELNDDGSFIEPNDPDAPKVSAFPLFKDDFVISGTWGDDSFDAWKSTDTNKMPKLTVKVRGNNVTPVNMANDGTWNATVPLSHVQNSDKTAVVGAMDIEISITDIGGSTTTFQKGYQIDTDEPKIEYVTCNKASGTYPNGTVFDITLNFNREVVVSGTPKLTLSNGKTATYKSGSGTKKLVFEYTVTGSGDDTDSLTITDGSYNSGSIKAGDLAYSENDFVTAVKSDSNKTMGKEIKILTAVPAYKSHSWVEDTKTLTLVFDGLVTANDGDVEIEQVTVLAPAYLTKDEYNATSTAVKAYYKEGTLGASSAFVSDLTTKYILDYDTETNNGTLVNAYKATGAHKRTVNIRSESVTSSQSGNTTTFTIVFEELPCKGATYKLNIPKDLVKNDAGTGNAASSTESKSTTSTSPITKTGVEPPVIRIKKAGQTIVDWNATQPLTTTFKVGCRTPSASVNYTYDAYTSGNYLVTRGLQNFVGNPIQEEIQIDFDYTDPNESHTYKTTQKGNPTRNGNTYTSGGKPTSTFKKLSSSSGTTSGTIGIDDYAAGLKYEITATSSKDSKTEKAYEVAYRTTIAFKDFYKLELENYKTSTSTIYGVKRNFDYWPYNESTKPVRMFIRGSDNKEGANSTAGLPCSWDLTDQTSTAMLTSISTARNEINYYFTTWSITVDNFYFKFMAGLCDNQTNTDKGAKGPQYSIYASEGLLFRSPEFPVGKGEYLILYDKDIDKYGIACNLSAGTVNKHRDDVQQP